MAVSIEYVGRLTERILAKEIKKQEKNFKYSAAIALTKTAKIAQKNVIAELPKVFDRPTPWTLRGTFVLPAKPTKIETKVAFKDDRAIPTLGQKGGTAAANYIKWQVEGGTRQQKGIERKLVALGILEKDEAVVPGDAVRLNRYGNMTRATLSKIIAQVAAGKGQGISEGFGQATTKTGRKRYFYDPNIRPRAIYERYGRGGKRIRPVLYFIKLPKYKKRLPFNDIVTKTFDRELDDEFDRQFNFR